MVTPCLGVTVDQRGSFQAEILRHRDLAFRANTGLYVTPNASELAAFNQLAAGLWSGSFLGGGSTALDAQAAALGYEFVRFDDTDTGHIYYGLREKLTNGVQTKGWGTYYANFSAITNGLAEAPHILHDIDTDEMAAKMFQRSAARGYLLAGAHRNSNGTGTADVAHLTNCCFHEVHKAWNGPTAQTTGWQIHGFTIAGFPDWPPGTDAVLANGGGGVNNQMIDLDARLEAADFETYCYNTYSVSDSRNVAINGSLPGSMFSGLAALSNVQGDYSRPLGGTFVHAELEQSIRFSAANKEIVSTILARSIAATDAWTAGFKRWDGGAGSSGVWTANNNWSTNGQPGSNDVVVFDNNFLAALPATFTLSASSPTLRGFVWNSPDSSQIVSATAGASDSVITLLGDPANPERPLLAIYPLATGATFTFSTSNTGGGTGQVKVRLGGSGAINVATADATLDIASQITEATAGARIQKTGPGLLILRNTANAFTGGVTITGGTLQTAGFSQLGPIPAAPFADFITLDGGTLRYSGSGINMNAGRGITVSPAGGAIEVRSATATLGIPGTLAGTGTLAVIGSGTLNVRHLRTDAVEINNPYVAVLAGRSTDSTSRVSRLSLAAGSRFDLSDQDLIIDYIGASPLNTIRSLIVSGYAAGAWTGAGILSSVAAAQPNGGIGYGEASALGLSSFSGQPVDATSVLVAYTLRGDANLDGSVGIADFARLGAKFNLPGGWIDGDFNYSGTVNIADFSLLAGNFNQSLPGGSARAVPEPGFWLAIPWICLARRRRCGVMARKSGGRTGLATENPPPLLPHPVEE